MGPSTISVIGNGRIGSALIEHITRSPDLVLGRVLTRSGQPDTKDIEAFLASPADLIIEVAGPDALRAYGTKCLGVADVRSVGGAALADTVLHAEMIKIASITGTRLRLFSPWAYGIDTAPQAAIRSLKITMGRPGMQHFSGPLHEAAKLFPGEVNFAVAAALRGPGIEKTDITLGPTNESDCHQITTECETEAGSISASIQFARTGRHPTALSLIAALEDQLSPVR